MYKVPSVVYTFDPPTRVLTQGVEFLSTLPEKLDLLTRYGIDEVIAVPFTREFAARPKEAFLGDLRTLRPLALVVGEDFHFGRGRAGGLSDLKDVSSDVVALPMHSLSGEDIKSTRIREMLAVGRHTTVKVLPKYTKKTTRQIVNASKKRRASRTKSGHLSE